MRNRIILLLAILCLLAITGCNSTDKDVADTILVNGTIITVDQEFSIQEAVAVKNGRILTVGSNDKINTYSGSNTTKIDLHGHTVIPGIIEGHLHPVIASQSELFQEIPDIHSIPELLSWIYQEVQRKKEGEWIIHPKFFSTRMQEMRTPTIEELDSVAPHNPVFLDGTYGGIVNSSAFHYSGITRPFKHPGILKDKNDKPTGFLRNSAFPLFKIDRYKNLNDSVKMEVLKVMLQLYNQVGITSICSGQGTAETMKLFRMLHDNGSLTTRVFQNIQIPFSPHASLDEMRESLQDLGFKTGDGDEWVKVGALKTLIDGGILTGTAFLREPWGINSKDIYSITDPSYRGILNMSKEELVRMVTAAAESGWKFTAHVTGGGGVDTLLAAYQIVNRSIPIHEKRFSIIHGNFFTPGSIQIMKELGVYADMQPAWFYKDTDLLNRVLGPERIRTFHPYRSLIEAGIIVNGGSDHMVKLDSYTSINPYNPFLGMWTVITRETERGTQFVPEQAINRERALRMYTINNALASFEEDQKGSLESGKYADLAVLSLDYLTCPVDSIKDIQVVMTMVDGKIVYNTGTW
jgi:predicted amidohydrolase YtcJ